MTRPTSTASVALMRKVYSYELESLTKAIEALPDCPARLEALQALRASLYWAEKASRWTPPA